MCLAVPARILSIDGALAEVEFGSVRRTISVQLLPQARVGDYVLVHTGFAISIIDPEEARRTLALLEAMEQERQHDTDTASPSPAEPGVEP